MDERRIRAYPARRVAGGISDRPLKERGPPMAGATAKSFIARLLVRPDRRDAFIALQTELKHLVFAEEPDATVYELLQSDADPNFFLVVATFRDDAAYERHMAIDFHDRLVPPILDCLASDMSVDYFRSHG
jgi:quinol monooxygenase YgiN